MFYIIKLFKIYYNRFPQQRAGYPLVHKEVTPYYLDDDIKNTMDLFRSMNVADGDFAFKFDLNPEGRINSRRQYACFGDVVLFDTTHTTNIYKMPSGLFVGVNNHF